MQTCCGRIELLWDGGGGKRATGWKASWMRTQGLASSGPAFTPASMNSVTLGNCLLLEAS